MSAAGWAARAVLVLVVAACVGLAAYVLSTQQETEYEASTRLLFDDTRPELRVLGAGYGDDPTDVDVRLANEAAEMDSFEHARRVARSEPELRLDAEAIADRVSAAPVRGTEIVELTATETTGERAVALAAAYRDAYLADRRREERRRADAAYDALEERLDDLPSEEQLGAAGATLRQQLGALAVLREVGSGTPRVIASPREPSSAAAPQTRRNVLYGVVLGVLLGVGLVALRGGLGRGRFGGPGAGPGPGARSAEAHDGDVGADGDGERTRPAPAFDRGV